MKTRILKVPSYAFVSNIEQEFYNLFNSNDGDSFDEIQLDFRGVQYIEPSTSTSYLIAMLYTCLMKGYRFKIIPPGDNGIKIILYAWRFFEVLEETTGISIAEFAPSIEKEFAQDIETRLGSTITRRLKCYRGIDGKDVQSYFRKRYLGQDSIYNLIADVKFFPLLSLNVSTDESRYQEFINEKARWEKEDLINLVLENNLKSAEIKKANNKKIADIIAADVISETIGNAMVHPNASKFFTGSYFSFCDKQRKEDKTSHFTINFWDNGESIIDTLGLPLKNKANIKSESAVKYFQSVTKNKSQIEFVIKKDDKSMYEAELFTTSSELHSNLDERRILLAAFFPGVSRLPDREPDLFNQSFPGIGLSYLTNTVINKLGGEIAVRTKQYFLNVKCLPNYDKDRYIEKHKASGTVKPRRKEVFDENSTYYRAKFTEFANEMPEFIGNMITIRIPLKYRTESEVV